jgi:hypothetical protein
MALWGNATVNNSPAPVESVVRAYLNGTLVGQVVIHESGIYGYTESTKQKLLIGNASGTITFAIQHPSLNNGAEIFSTASEQFASGSTINKDFSFSFTVQTPPVSAPSPASSGGGGGGGYIPVIIIKGDINGDSKVDKYDFSLMMSNWGKTGSNNCDLNNDSKVDKYDFALLMSKWGL